MKHFLTGLIDGISLAAVPAAVGEFGWTDTSKLERVAVAAEGIPAEIRGLRVQLGRQFPLPAERVEKR